ncbi:hypothetical protein M378DRAFT_283192 [Amanita muscaria Koide BX008]|uniref:Uncharacterized protein n=1 Tax=Amanita muscaria (strain Koide BX008) TaxID=946122 RepID=A0A0C2SY13_AMAMK|nr:hypothetical protein M378DRAFT_283192 [Amanita muscaria Koide BX008]
MNRPVLQTYLLPKTHKALPHGPSFLRHKSDVVGTQVAELAHMLMKQAWDEGLVFRQKDNEKLKDAVALTSTKQDHTSRSLSMGEAAMTLRAVASSTVRDKDKERQASRGGRGNIMQHVSSPLFGALRSSNNAGEKTIIPRRGPNSGSHAMMQGSDSPRGSSIIPGSGAATTTSATTANASTPTKRSSVPLEYIIPVSSKPPTLFPVHLRPIQTRRLRSLQPRVGQLLDPIPTLFLLLRARDCKSTAPACLTGAKIADRTKKDTKKEVYRWRWGHTFVQIPAVNRHQYPPGQMQL